MKTFKRGTFHRILTTFIWEVVTIYTRDNCMKNPAGFRFRTCRPHMYLSGMGDISLISLFFFLVMLAIES